MDRNTLSNHSGQADDLLTHQPSRYPAPVRQRPLQYPSDRDNQQRLFCQVQKKHEKIFIDLRPFQLPWFNVPSFKFLRPQIHNQRITPLIRILENPILAAQQFAVRAPSLRRKIADPCGSVGGHVCSFADPCRFVLRVKADSRPDIFCLFTNLLSSETVLGRSTSESRRVSRWHSLNRIGP